MKNLCAIYAENGPPSATIQIESRERPQPQAGELLIRMELAPVNPSDLNMIEGTYGIKASLPAVAGNEGVGVVEALGPGVDAAWLQRRVRPATGTGTWQQWVACPASDCLRFPASLSAEQAAMLYVNPATAWRMLHDFIPLQPGEWVIQNAANSAVGRSVIQIAKAQGWKSINLVRRPEVIQELRDLGADAVLLDEPDSLPAIKELCGSHAPRLALNAVGGESVQLLSKAVATGAKIVTYGAMSKQGLRLGNGLLIFKDLSYHGYWVSRWYQQAERNQIDAMFESLAQLNLQIPVAAIHPLSEVREALAAAEQGRRNGKILLRLNE
ncbi:MAG: zinc-dependent alcohol dehydrogenase family protein [Blastochloris sp.]|nr:zinc-dependent alcohol dehydrogenase family protein [Blastochloris sp.]